MKVIVRTETMIGSGTDISAYIPKDTDGNNSKDYYNAMEKLYSQDLNYFGDKVEDAEIWEDDLTAYVFSGDYSIHYDIMNINEI